ncbi:MAG: alkaline phosphatase family protein [Thermoanaerobaculia bacterium]
MRRSLLAATVVIVAALIALTFIRFVPQGFGRVTRHGSQIAVHWHRVAFVAPLGGKPCFVPRRGEQLFFQRSIGDLNINFAYEPPSSLPDRWPAGDWCESLSKFVEANVHTTGDQLLSDPRAVEARVSAGLQRALASANLKTSSVSARAQLPPGWERTRPVQEIKALARKTPPVLFAGLDGADWELLDDYIASGAMPNLARLVREGSSGVLETEHPPLSPLLWNTMMTGVSPLEHQILDFVHFNAASGAKEPITTDERAMPAVWNMATMAGKRVAVFGLWATYPAEPVNGLLVSDRLFTFLYTESTPPPGIVFPPSRESWARASVTAAEQSIDFATMHQFLPWLTEKDAGELAREQDPYAKPGSALRRILVETEVYRKLANDVFATSMPDLSIVYIQGTDTIGHVFAPFTPPRQPEVSAGDYERYNQVPELYFRRIDHLLGELLRAAEKNHAAVMLASDHGFRWKEGRPVKLSSVATATAAKWHRNDGIYLLWGPGITRNNHHGRGGIRQVCATLLDLCGLPRARGVAQTLRPRASARGLVEIDYRHYFERFIPPAATSATAASANEELSKLRALGYIGSGESTARPAGTSSTKSAGSYNNAGLILKHENRIGEAITSFHEALKLDPNLASAAWNLSDLLFSRSENLAEADDLLLRALQNGLPEAPKYVIERAIKYQRSGHADRSLSLLEGAVTSRGDDAELRMFRGRYRVEQRNCAGALEDFTVAERLRPDDPVAFASAGLAQICLGNQAEARASFRRSLELDPNQPMLSRFLRRIRD